MQRQIGSILLITGTCIGSGMIALPMVFSKIGLLPSFILTFFIWGIMYYTSLINIELNLQAGKGMTLGLLGKQFSGRGAQLVGEGSLKLLSYALLAVFIYGGASVLQKLFLSLLHKEVSFTLVSLSYGICSFFLLVFPVKVIDYLNRLLFGALLGVFFILMGGLFMSIQGTTFPWVSPDIGNFSTWRSLLPVVFTSFGFQVIFHTLTNYCGGDKKMLKRAFFWGSLLPALVYMIWTGGVLSLLFQGDPVFYDQMKNGQTDVGDLVEKLSLFSSVSSVQLWVWWISILAILTSVLGVGVGLVESWESFWEPRGGSPLKRRFLGSALTFFPSTLVAVGVPHGFISVLGVAGMILAVIAILLPSYLFYRIRHRSLYYQELRVSWLFVLSLLGGIVIILCELGTLGI